MALLHRLSETAAHQRRPRADFLTTKRVVHKDYESTVAAQHQEILFVLFLTVSTLANRKGPRRVDAALHKFVTVYANQDRVRARPSS